MANCPNKNHIDFKNLLKDTGLNEFVLQAKIGVWQDENNNLDRFPTVEELKNTKQVFKSSTPSVSTTAGFLQEVGLNKKQIDTSRQPIINKAVEKYNAKNGTSYYIKYKQVGQSNLVTWQVVDNRGYTSINENEVNYTLKAINILNSTKADEIFRKGDKNNWSLDKILNELQVPKDQQELIKSFNTRNRNEIITSLLASYSFTVEINTAKSVYRESIGGVAGFELNGDKYDIGRIDDYNEVYYKNNIEISEKEFNDAWNIRKTQDATPTQYYSNLTVPGGTNYTENEISTPLITPSIKGHAQFSTDNGIGWFRSDDKAPQIKGWQKDEVDWMDSESAIYNAITPNDKIIWGHPAIGKTYAANKLGFIDFDSYKIGINKKYNLHITKGLTEEELRKDKKTREAREEWRYENKANEEKWNQFIREVWKQAKKDAKSQNKLLFASDLLILREFSDDVDKAITIPDELFFQRSKQRNNFIEGEKGTKQWKTNINKAVSELPQKKIITTDKYLSDLLEPQVKTRRILELQSDLFQKGRESKNLSESVRQSYLTNPEFLRRKKELQDKYSNKEITGHQLDVENSKLVQEFINKNQDSSNQFLQLLNKDNNWVTFFVKAIIQSTAKETTLEAREEDITAKIKELEQSGELKIEC